MEENQIKTLTVTEFLGKNFFIPEYQRGYRWTKTNVGYFGLSVAPFQPKRVALIDRNNHPFQS